jgi:ring-1,2-phenylacetyl-CoA epoxidase subunit PaaD
VSAAPATLLSASEAWAVLESVPDPEIPIVSVIELGIVRKLETLDSGVRVTVTPTYSGCPASELIADSIRDALVAAGAGRVEVVTRLAPAWTTDWITEAAREKLRAYGIAPPCGGVEAGAAARPLRFVPPRPACPRCGARDTVRLSEFGSTACKALYRCRDCLEPFDYFKPI